MTHNQNYGKGHVLVAKVRGRPHICQRCGTTRDGVVYDWANLTGDYLSPNDYARMCRPCHADYDAGIYSRANRMRQVQAVKDWLAIATPELVEAEIMARFSPVLFPKHAPISRAEAQGEPKGGREWQP